MKSLFNLGGYHIATLVRNHLHSPNGNNIGHFLESYGIFVDMNGRYMGEIKMNNRLVFNNFSSHKNSIFSKHGNYGNVGSFGNPGNIGSVSISGCRDITIDWEV